MRTTSSVALILATTVPLMGCGEAGRCRMRASMSRTGDCWDNAVAESFFASLKGEWLDHDWYPSHAAARRAIADYIDSFYNPLRRHSTIGYISPDEFELRAQMAKVAA